MYISKIWHKDESKKGSLLLYILFRLHGHFIQILFRLFYHCIFGEQFYPGHI